MEKGKAEEKMDSRELAALLSSLTSQLLLTLLLSPSSLPLQITTIPNNSHHGGNPFPLLLLLLHFLSTSDLAASLSLLPKKRKRQQQQQQQQTHHPNPQPGQLHRVESVTNLKLGEPHRVDSVIPRDPDSFNLSFRMRSSTFEWLASLLEPLLECRDPAGTPLSLPAETRLGVGLFRLATGADYSEVSGRFKVSGPVARFCVKQLCRVLCTNFRFWVGFPSASELGDVSSGFESVAGMPNCCGVVGCARFGIAKRTGEGRGSSIAAQIVVDSSSRILNIVAGFGGNNSDWAIFKSSSLYKDIESGSLLDSPPIYINGVSIPQYLVGDRHYPLFPWLITSFPDPVSGRNEEDFNAALKLMRLPAIRTIASLKSWGVLNKPIEAEFKTAVAYIGACSILHNVLLMREDYSSLCDEFVDYTVDDQVYRNANFEENSVELKGSVIRSALATRAQVVSKSDQPMDLGNEE